MPRGKPRKDVMKAVKTEVGRIAKPEGGMAHSVDKKEDIWGGKKPPFPRSELSHKSRGGMALINK